MKNLINQQSTGTSKIIKLLIFIFAFNSYHFAEAGWFSSPICNLEVKDKIISKSVIDPKVLITSFSTRINYSNNDKIEGIRLQENHEILYRQRQYSHKTTKPVKCYYESRWTETMHNNLYYYDDTTTTAHYGSIKCTIEEYVLFTTYQSINEERLKIIESCISQTRSDEKSIQLKKLQIEIENSIPNECFAKSIASQKIKTQEELMNLIESAKLKCR